MTKSSTIFIAIGAYNESYLDQTVRNAIQMAKYPERLKFGIWSHNNDGVLPSFPDLHNVRIITAQYPTLLGVCPSRMGALFLYDEEDYYLQIDAHMLFQQDWDEVILEKYSRIEREHPNSVPLISTYVPWWSNNENGDILHYSANSEYKSHPMRYIQNVYVDANSNPAPVPMQENYHFDWNTADFVEHYNISAHFIFTRGSFVRDVLPDIDMMFYGEEQTTALRAWTRGYRIFAIPEPIVWHYNKGASAIYKYDRWSTVGDYDLYRYFDKKQGYSHDKAKKILTGEITGYWGAPSGSLLSAYEKACGFSFKKWYVEKEKFDTNTI